ncbi:MAG TPA: hypothetical protein VGR47_05815 [Terracidiphilus sp.]|nr:hypothetical protein [Terracidiphilus sp.]
MEHLNAASPLSIREAEEFWSEGEDARAAAEPTPETTSHAAHEAGCVEYGPAETCDYCRGAARLSAGIDLPGVGHVYPQTDSAVRSCREAGADAPLARRSDGEGELCLRGGEPAAQMARPRTPEAEERRERLLCQLIFAAQALAEAQILADGDDVPFCAECVAEALKPDAIAHDGDCSTGRVLRVLRELGETLPGKGASGGESGAAPEGIQAPVPEERLCRSCGVFGSAGWTSRYIGDWTPAVVGANQVLEEVYPGSSWLHTHGCEHVRAAMTVDWVDDVRVRGNDKLRKPGAVLSVCVDCGCKVHRKEYEKERKSAPGERHDVEAEKEKRRKSRQAAIAESKIRLAVAARAIEGLKELPGEALRAIVRKTYCGSSSFDEGGREALVPGLEEILAAAKVTSAKFARAAGWLSIEELRAVDWRESKLGREQFLSSIARLGYKDGANAWEEAKKASQPKAPAKKFVLSAEAKKRIAAAQKKRWGAARAKKGGAK